MAHDCGGFVRQSLPREQELDQGSDVFTASGWSSCTQGTIKVAILNQELPAEREVAAHSVRSEHVQRMVNLPVALLPPHHEARSAQTCCPTFICNGPILIPVKVPIQTDARLFKPKLRLGFKLDGNHQSGYTIDLALECIPSPDTAEPFRVRHSVIIGEGHEFTEGYSDPTVSSCRYASQPFRDDPNSGES
jgi:hypothetical protein